MQALQQVQPAAKPVRTTVDDLEAQIDYFLTEEAEQILQSAHARVWWGIDLVREATENEAKEELQRAASLGQEPRADAEEAIAHRKTREAAERQVHAAEISLKRARLELRLALYVHRPKDPVEIRKCLASYRAAKSELQLATAAKEAMDALTLAWVTSRQRSLVASVKRNLRRKAEQKALLFPFNPDDDRLPGFFCRWLKTQVANGAHRHPVSRLYLFLTIQNTLRHADEMGTLGIPNEDDPVHTLLQPAQPVTRKEQRDEWLLDRQFQHPNGDNRTWREETELTDDPDVQSVYNGSAEQLKALVNPSLRRCRHCTSTIIDRIVHQDVEDEEAIFRLTRTKTLVVPFENLKPGYQREGWAVVAACDCTITHLSRIYDSWKLLMEALFPEQLARRNARRALTS